MQNLKSRGVSEVVTVILILLVSVSLVVVLFAIINKNINAVSLSPEVDCAGYNINPSVMVKDACFNLSSGEAEVLVERNNENPEISKIEFIFDYASETGKYACGEGCLNCKVLDSGSKRYFFITNKMPEEIVLKVDNCILRNRKEVRAC